MVCGFHGVCLDCVLPGVQVASHWAGMFTKFKSFYVIVKIVTPCFRRPSLLSRSLVGTLAWPGHARVPSGMAIVYWK